MKKALFLYLLALLAYQIGFSQGSDKTGSMAIMASVVSSKSMNSVPLKISVSGAETISELTLTLSEKESAQMIFTGTPYGTVNIQIPSEQVVANQFGQTARVKDFQLIYGNSEDQTAMDVVSPGSCNKLMIPETGRIYIRIAATVRSESELEGVYTGSADFECSSE